MGTASIHFTSVWIGLRCLALRWIGLDWIAFCFDRCCSPKDRIEKKKQVQNDRDGRNKRDDRDDRYNRMAGDDRG